MSQSNVSWIDSWVRVRENSIFTFLFPLDIHCLGFFFSSSLNRTQFSFYNRPFICSSDSFSSIMKTRTELKADEKNKMDFYVCGPINNDKSLANRSEHVRHASEIILTMPFISSLYFIALAWLLLYTFYVSCNSSSMRCVRDLFSYDCLFIVMFKTIFEIWFTFGIFTHPIVEYKISSKLKTAT